MRYNDDGLVPAIVQEDGTGAVLMMAWMNAGVAAPRRSRPGGPWFWSRSRQEYWCKGETSGDRQWIRAAYYDCDGDTLLFVVEQEGAGACHTGRPQLLLPGLRRPTTDRRRHRCQAEPDRGRVSDATSRASATPSYRCGASCWPT